MSVGIGALCNGGQNIVMAVDTRGTWNDPRFPNHEQTGKQYDLPFYLCANIAGQTRVCASLVSELTVQLDKLADEAAIYHDHIRNAIREAQLLEHIYRLDYELILRLGMRLTEWKAMDEARLNYRRGERIVKNFEIKMQLTVGGFVHNSAVLLETNYSNAPEIVDMSVIGSGADLANEKLLLRGQHGNTSLHRTLVHVAEAMQAARQDQFVGDPADFVVLSPRSFRRFPAHDKFLEQLLVKYHDKSTEELDDTEEAFKKLKSSLYFPGTTKDEMARGLRRPIAAGLPTPSRAEERIDGDWMITRWANGIKTFSLPRGSTRTLQRINKIIWGLRA
jgi:hypothetical protein